MKRTYISEEFPHEVNIYKVGCVIQLAYLPGRSIYFPSEIDLPFERDLYIQRKTLGNVKFKLVEK